VAIAALLPVLAAAAGTTPAARLPALQGVQWHQPARPVTDFTLLDQHARKVKFSSLRGKTVLVFFGFANCPDICPTTMHELQLASAMTRVDRSRLQVLMISVDGKRDTPAVLRAFLATQSDRFMAMTGDPVRVAEIAAQFPAAFITPPEAASARSYMVTHTDSVYVVDAQGRLRATMSKASVNDIARATEIVQKSAGSAG
jgi:protein SCO1/2